MHKLHFSIHINAPRQKVWETMLAPDTYQQWTKAFDESSRYEGSWDQGSTIRFFGTDEHGKTAGMVSMIAESRMFEFISIKHVGIIKNGNEVTTGKAVEEWAGAFENYTFQDRDGGTELLIDIDTLEKHTDFFNQTWPKALEKLKELAEA